jgi:hypothetical protein
MHFLNRIFFLQLTALHIAIPKLLYPLISFMSVLPHLTVLQRVSLTVSKSLISAIQFTFQPSPPTEPTLNSPVAQFQFLCFTATSYNSFLLTRNVSFCLIFTALNTPHSPLDLHKSPSHNALTQMSP